MPRRAKKAKEPTKNPRSGQQYVQTTWFTGGDLGTMWSTRIPRAKNVVLGHMVNLWQKHVYKTCINGVEKILHANHVVCFMWLTCGEMMWYRCGKLEVIRTSFPSLDHLYALCQVRSRRQVTLGVGEGILHTTTKIALIFIKKPIWIRFTY